MSDEPSTEYSVCKVMTENTSHFIVYLFIHELSSLLYSKCVKFWGLHPDCTVLNMTLLWAAACVHGSLLSLVACLFAVAIVTGQAL